MNTSAQRDLPPRPYFASEDGSIQIPFNPRLAKAVGGIGPSLLLRQIAYWIRNDRIDFYDPHIIFADGLWYIRLTSGEIASRLEDCMDDRTIRRYLKKLEDNELIFITTKFNTFPRLKDPWIALLPITVRHLPGVEYIMPNPPIGQNDQPIGQNDQSATPPTNGSTTPESTAATIGQNDQSVIYIQESEEASPNQIKEGEANDASAAPPVQSSIIQAIDFWAVKAEIARVCQLDPFLRDGMIGKYAKQLCSAGYGIDAILTAEDYWYQVDWRGKKGDIPRIDELIDTLPRAKEWKQSLTDSTSSHYDPWEGKKGDYSDYYEVQA